MSDTFWPMIFGETGLLGTLVYLIILYKAFGLYVKGFLKDTSDKRYVMPAFSLLFFRLISRQTCVFRTTS